MWWVDQKKRWRLFPPEFVWAEVEERLLTLSYSYRKDKVINLYRIKCYAESDKYVAMTQINKKNSPHLPRFWGLVRRVCGGDGGDLLSVSQQRSIGRFYQTRMGKITCKQRATLVLNVCFFFCFFSKRATCYCPQVWTPHGLHEPTWY